MKRLTKLLTVILVILLLTACSDETTTDKTTNKQTTSSEEPLVVNSKDIEGLDKMTCTREGNLDDGEVKLTYDLYYEGEDLILLHAIEEVITEDSSILDEYENAYKSIRENYLGLNYYDTAVVRTNDSVTNDTIINYGKIDINKLLEIEGEEDNIIVDGKAKVDSWLELAEQFGTECE